MKKQILLLLLPLLLASCNGEATSSNASSTSSQEPSQAIVVDRYVSDVASTAPFMVAGIDGDKKVDYVISSHPVIFSAMSNENKKTNISIYASVAEKFSQKYSTEGFLRLVYSSRLNCIISMFLMMNLSLPKSILSWVLLMPLVRI